MCCYGDAGENAWEEQAGPSSSRHHEGEHHESGREHERGPQDMAADDCAALGRVTQLLYPGQQRVSGVSLCPLVSVCVNVKAVTWISSVSWTHF